MIAKKKETGASDVPSDFLDQLRAIYIKEYESDEIWQEEQPLLGPLVEQISDAIQFNYTLIKPFALGGTAIISLVRDKNLDILRALKFPRPIRNSSAQLTKILITEREHLLRLNHQNLMKIYAQGTTKDADIPFYIMEYIEKIKDADRYFMQTSINEEGVLAIFYQILVAVEHMHEKGTIHLDLKPANINITPDGIPIVSDLGSAKDLRDRDPDRKTYVVADQNYMHPGLKQYIKDRVAKEKERIGKTTSDKGAREKDEGKRERIPVANKELKKAWDLFSVGKTFLLLLRVLDEYHKGALSAYQKRYLRLVACRLLDGHNESADQRVLGYSQEVFRNYLRYETASNAREDIEKLMGTYNLEGRVPELQPQVAETIQVGSLTITPFTECVKATYENPILSKLGHVSQLGLLTLVYPSATHSRLEHALGTFSILCRYIPALFYDEWNPVFRQIMTDEDFRAVLVAALLHDVGYYPLAHDFEEADPELDSHDVIGVNLLKRDYGEIGKIIEGKWKTSVSRVIQILEGGDQNSLNGIKARILRSLIDGPLDADKVDYLTRDSTRLGLKYGANIDFDRFLRCLTTIFESQGSGYRAELGVHQKGKVAADTVVSARHDMYEQVYWHHTYRAFKAMLSRLVLDALSNQANEANKKGGSLQLRTEFLRFAIEIWDKESGLLEDSGGLPELSDRLEWIAPNSGDGLVVDWFAARAGVKGQELHRLICHRKLFKRLFVVSSINDRPVWEKLIQFFESRSAWEPRLKLQEGVQESIIRFIKRLEVTEIVGVDMKDEFLRRAQGEVLILLDVPGRPSAADAQFRFILEEARHRYKTDDVEAFAVGSAEDAGARHKLEVRIRLFCHADFRDFLVANLKRAPVVEDLSVALREVVASKSVQ